jgi:uncharacterized protein (TIGR02996 family)
VTTEDDFQAALDADPADWQTRLVLADFLQERGDPRADGYRALGALRKRPAPSSAKQVPVEELTLAMLTEGPFNYCRPGTEYGAIGAAELEPFALPSDWLESIPRLPGAAHSEDWSQPCRTRRAAEDAAALAFAQLPAARRAEMLTVGADQ